MVDEQLLRRARRKKRQGEPLTEAEDEALATYYRGVVSRSTRIYWSSDEERDAIMDLKEEEGASSLSKFLIQLIRRGVEAGEVRQADYEDAQERIERLTEMLRLKEQEADELARDRDEWIERYVRMSDYAGAFLEAFQRHGILDLVQVTDDDLAAMREAAR